MTGTILIIGGRLQAIHKAKELGLRVVLLQHKERLLPGQAEAADALLLVDYLDWEVARPLVLAAHRVYGFTAVVSLVDQAMELVGRINDLLGLPGTSHEVAHRFHDKLAMRQWLRGTGFETVAAEPVGDPAALRAFGERHGYPFVIKPVDGTGSRGVVRVDGPDRIDALWERVTGLRGRQDLVMATFYPVDRFIAEEYIDGPEYSAETFSFDGRHIVVSFTDKLTDGLVEIGHAVPAALTPDDEAALEHHVVAYLTAMGLRDGVGHVELKMSSRRPRIIEGHDRVAGDRIMDLVGAVCGIDLERYAVGWPHRLVPALAERPAPRRAAATRFLSAEPGTVVGIDGAGEVRDYPGVLDLDVAVGVGDRVREVTDNFDRPGQVLVAADDTQAAVALCASLVEKVHIATSPTPHDKPSAADPEETGQDS
jgi:biotin carboxylase